jgi:hypothetical protein
MQIRFVATVLLSLPLFASIAIAAEDKKPNFAIIFVDDMGYGNIEPFGSSLGRPRRKTISSLTLVTAGDALEDRPACPLTMCEI